MEQSKARTFFDSLDALHGISVPPYGGNAYRPLSAAEIRKLLPPDIALLEYYVGEESVIAALLAADRFEVRRLATDARQLRREVGAFSAAIKHKGPYLQSGGKLYETLVSPFAGNCPATGGWASSRTACGTIYRSMRCRLPALRRMTARR
jgi:hypothetical protein